MSNWPTIDVPQEFEETTIKDTIRTPFEGGYVQTRARYSRTRRRFTLRWRVLSNTDKNTLDTFFETTVHGGADSFTYTHPKTSTQYTVRFAKDEFTREYVHPDLWSVEVELEEV